MDLHQIRTGLSTATTTIGSSSYPPHLSSTPTPSSSSSPTARHHIHHFQQQQHHQGFPHQQHLQQQQQLYNLLPPQITSYSPTTITLPPIPNTNSDRNDEAIASSPSWPRSREFQHQPHQPQLHQPQSSGVKRETLGKNTEGRSMDDAMPSTSDFVKKLYKFVFIIIIFFRRI